MAKLTREEAKLILAEWRKDRIENPEEYQSMEDWNKTTPEEYAEIAVEQFMELQDKLIKS